MASNPIPKIDSKNNIVGETTIKEARDHGWPRRVTRVFIFNEKEQVLLQKRSKTAAIHPDVWDCSGGHVDLAESYTEAGEREIHEELQAQVTVKEVAAPVFFEDTFYTPCTSFVDSNTEFVLKEDEVTDAKWVSRDELSQMIALHPSYFTPWLVHMWENYENKMTSAV